MVRPTLIDLNPVDLKYYLFMITLDKCTGSCNSIDDLSMRIFVPSRRKEVNVKIFHMITNRDEAKTLVKHISCDCKCKHCRTFKKGYSWNPSICIFEHGKYLKVLPTIQKLRVMKLHMLWILYQQKIANNVLMNITSAMSVNCHNKKVRYKMVS